MKSTTSMSGCSTIARRCPPISAGSSTGTWSRVTTSEYTDDNANSSGRLVNLPTRVTGRSFVPVALTSTVVCVAVNAAPQSPSSDTPAASSKSGRKYVCITHNSPNELAIGVPVAKVATRSTTRWAGMPAALASSRRRSRNTRSFNARSSARSEELVQFNSVMLQTLCKFL